MRTQDDLQRTIRELLAEERRNLGSHLKLEDVTTYHGGTLSPEEEERIQEHLAACPECSALLLDLEGLSDPSNDGAVSQAELAAAWRVVGGRLRQEMAGTAGKASSGGRSPIGSPWLHALAAILLLAVGTLAFQVVRLQHLVGDVPQPQLNAPVLDLRPSVRGEGIGAAAPEVPSRARLFTLVINPVGSLSQGTYAVEIIDAAGKRAWSGQGLELNSFGSFSLALSRRTLSAGEYRLRLFSLTTGHRQLIGEYAFRVQAP